MINLSVTGKKVVSPNPPKKQPQIINPFIIQTKPISQKPQAPIKPKPSPMQTPKVPPKKQSAIKVEPKKQTPVKKQEKMQQKKAPEPVKIQQKKEEKVGEPQHLIQPKNEDIIGQVTVRYNHYKQEFPSVNGILSFLPIQQKYGFADVFKGKYLPVLKKFKSQEMIPPETMGLAVEYSWNVEEGEQYRLEITQDQQEELKYDKKVYKAPGNVGNACNCPFKKNPRFDELTAQLKKLDPSQYGSAKHKALLQQRDLQDVLFS